jgi:PAS domain S-box-containing protein
LVQFFENDESLATSVSRFVEEALNKGAGVAIIATEVHLEAIINRLHRLGIETSGLKQSGQLRVLEASKALSEFVIDGEVNEAKFKTFIGDLVAQLRSQFGAAYAYGEMVGLLWERGDLNTTLALEDLWNGLGKIHGFTLLCGYSLKTFADAKDAHAFSAICDAHSRVLPSGELKEIEAKDWQLRTIAFLQQQSLALANELKRRNTSDELEAAQQEAKFRLIVESVKDYAIFMLDPEGYVATWNEGAKRIKGYDANEIIGTHFSRFYTSKDQAARHPEEELVIAAAEGRYEEEGWRVRKDGSFFWASVVITALRDSDKKLKGFAKVTRDLTERKQAEELRLKQERESIAREKIKESEETLDLIFSQSPSFMTFLSVPGYRYLRSNEQHLRLIRKRDIIGKALLEVEPELEAQGIVEILDEVVKTGRPFVGKEFPVTYFEDKSSRTEYIDFVYQPVRRPNGEIYGISAQGYVVTEKVLSRKAVENERENFRRLFKQTPEMVCILKGPHHVFVFVNEAHIRALGFDATGMSVRKAQPESTEVHGILDRVYRTGKTAQLHEIPVTVTGRLRYFNLTYAARRDDAGQIDGIMVLGVEVTDKKLAEKTLENSTAELERAVAQRTYELQASRNFLDSAIENIPHMIFIKDAQDLSFVSFNRAGEELLGFS